MAVLHEKVRKSLRTAAKTDSRRVHITPRSRGWAVRKEGNLHASKVVKTQKEAIEIGRKWIAEGKSSAIVIHNRSGQFRSPT